MADERQLISQLRQGSHKAFDIMYGLYARRLYEFCLRYNKSPYDSEDIVQETFVKLWQNRANLKDADSLGPYLITTSKNLLINSFKKRVNSNLYLDYVTYIDAMRTENTDSALDFNEFMILVDKKIKQLPQTQQKVIRLSRFEDLSNKEICEVLNLKDQTVRNQLSMGLKHLRELLYPVVEEVIASIVLVLGYFTAS